MKKAILSALLGLAIVISCEKKQEKISTEENLKTEQTASEENVKEAQEKSDEHKEGAKLELNNGAKWAVNNEMKPFVNQTETLLNSYNSETGDYKMLATKLNATNEKLVKSCTMTGVPHDNLHVWLAPHMKEIEKLKTAENRDYANKIVSELKESMEKFHQYFD